MRLPFSLADRLEAKATAALLGPLSLKTFAGLCRSCAFSIPAARNHVRFFLEAGNFQFVVLESENLKSQRMHMPTMAEAVIQRLSIWAIAMPMRALPSRGTGTASGKARTSFTQKVSAEKLSVFRD